MYDVIKSILLGVAGIIGGGIFLLNGFLVYNNTNYTPLVWLIGMIIFLFISYAFMLLSIDKPSNSGIMMYTEKHLDNPTIEPYAKAGIIFAFLSITSVYSLSVSEYISKYIGYPNIKLISVGIVITCILMNYMPKKYFLNTIYSFVIGKLAILIFLIIYGIYLPISKAKLENVQAHDMKKPLIMLFPVLFLFSMRAFLSYEGIEFLSNMSENIENKQTMIPASYIITILIVASIYMGIAFVTNKHVNGKLNPDNFMSSFLLLVKSYGFTTFGPIMIVILVCLANFSAINSTFHAIDESLQSFLKITNNKFLNSFNKQISIPFVSETRNLYIWIFGAIIICINMLPVLATTNLASMSFLMFFCYSSYLAYKYINKKQERKEPIKLFNKQINHTIGKFPCYFVFVATSVAFVLLLIDNFKILTGRSNLAVVR
jgi:amino acid transporter